MSKFNKTIKEITKIQNTPDTINAAGTPAFDRNNIKQDIANVVLTSMLSGNSFYETEAEALGHKNNLASLEKSLEAKAVENNPYAEQIEDLKHTALQPISWDGINTLTKLKEHQEFLHKLLKSLIL